MKSFLILLSLPPAVIFPCRWIGSLAISPAAAGFAAFILAILIIGFLLSKINAKELPYFQPVRFAYYRTHQARDGMWTAYGSLRPIDIEDIFDPMIILTTAQHANEEEAINAVIHQLEANHGARRWLRSSDGYPLYPSTDPFTLH